MIFVTPKDATVRQHLMLRVWKVNPLGGPPLGSPREDPITSSEENNPEDSAISNALEHDIFTTATLCDDGLVEPDLKNAIFHFSVNLLGPSTNVAQELTVRNLNSICKVVGTLKLLKGMLRSHII